MQPDESTKYPAQLTNVDATLQEFFGKMAQFQQEAASLEPVEACRRFWKMLRPIYVTDPDKAEKFLQWERCDLPNERNLMPYWVQHLLPSVQAARPTAEDLARVMLSVDTSPERAAAIEGDLLEEREIHGTRWFVLHVIRTTLALFGLALTQARAAQ